LTSLRSWVVTASWGTSRLTPRAVPPVSSASKLALNFSRLSLTAAKPADCPCAASALPRASRCESICISVAVAAAADVCVDCRESRNTMRAARSRNATISTPRVWNCLTTGRLPMIGSRLGLDAGAALVRSCSMIVTDASGS